MSGLPQGWAQASVADVTTPFMSIDPTKTPDKHFRYVDIGSIDNKTQTITDPKYFLGRDAPSRARRLICTGDTLFSTVRTYLKNIAVVPRELDGELTSTGIAVLRPNDAVDAGYLFRWACSDGFVGALSSAQDGTMYPAVSDRDVAVAAIPLPPLPEQRRIVATIDSIIGKSRRARDELDHIPRLVEKYKQAVLAAAFRGDLTRKWREKNSAAAWQSTTLGAVVKIASGQTPKGIETRLSKNGEIPWFKVSSMNEPDNLAGLRASQFRLSRRDARALGLRIVAAGSIAFPKRGGAIATNKKRKLLVDGALDLNLMVLTATGISADFLWWWMQKLDLASISNGSNVPQINNGDIAPLAIEVPSPPEQAEVARLLDVAFSWIDRLASEATSAHRLIHWLDRAVLAKAFRGELVPQNPDDEPASVLLDRIRVERRTVPGPRARRKTA